MIKKILVLLYLLLSIPHILGYGISGIVKDSKSKKPLIGANVIILGTSNGAATDEDGRYTIKNIDSLPFTVSVQYMGYESFTKIIDDSFEEIVVLDISLDPKVLQLETYVVSASRRKEKVEDAPAAISVISKTEIRRESNTNLGDYIKGTKGIDFTQSGIDSYNITARGFNSSFSSRLLTLTDGRVANVPSLRLNAYNVIPVSFEDVEQIEVVLGPASALYGPNAHSGILNIITSSPIRSQGTSFNIQGGMIGQDDTDLIKKFSFRSAHKYKNFGFKVSGVLLSGQDWRHFNSDEYEGHDPLFIGRPNLIHNHLDDGGMLGEEGSPIFSAEMVEFVNGADQSWIGKFWGDRISENGELGSPIITQEMIDAASDDPFQRFYLDNGITLWFVTQDKLGYVYADGKDNNGDGAIDEGVDRGIDDAAEKWYDGVDNDGDGIVDENDEIGSAWLDRFESFNSGGPGGTTFSSPDSVWTVVDSRHKSGLGNYLYDSEGNLVFDTNKNNVYGDDWGSDGLDNDNDWGLYIDQFNNPFDVSHEPLVDLNGNLEFDQNYSEIFIDNNGNGIWDSQEPLTDLNGDGIWNEGEVFEDINGDGNWNPAEFLLDFGVDRVSGNGDYGEGNGIWDGESYTDLNGNGMWEIFTHNDLDNNLQPSTGEVGVDEIGEGDFHPNYGSLTNIYKDANDDGINDFPDFNVRNARYEMRMDWEPSNDFGLVFSHGYAWARNINITPIARFIADGWVYKYYQSRLRYKNLFAQAYLNTSYSGDINNPTRNLGTGGVIFDRSKTFSAQLQHVNSFFNDRFRFVWGIDYFLTIPDTKGSILSDSDQSDRMDNDGDGEAGSPTQFFDANDNTSYDDGEAFNLWNTENGTPEGTILSLVDSVQNAISDGIDNDGDSDDYVDLNNNGIPDFVDENNSGSYDYGEQVEPGVQWFGNNIFKVVADGIDNDNDGKIDENIDEGIDEDDEDNRYKVNELGIYYQANWKINDKWELIQATRFDTHDRLSNFINFNNQYYGTNYSPFRWNFNFNETEGLQVSPKFGLIHRPRENQNLRLTWAKAFNTPSNQSLFLDLFVQRASIFKVYAKGADGGYTFPRDSLNNPYYYSTEDFDYFPVNFEEHIYFYPSIDPRSDGTYSRNVSDLPEIGPETVTSWEFGYKGKLNDITYGTLDIYTSHYSSFISPVTFVTPIVVDIGVLETDYNNDGIINRIDDLENKVINDEEDYEESFNNVRAGLQGVTAMDTTPGFTPPVVVGYVNYGEVDMWGFDGSLTFLISRNMSADVNYSYLGMSEFYNPVTKNNDPINAPRHKLNLKLTYNSLRHPFSSSLSTRYVDGYNWSSGIYYGNIKTHMIFDAHVSYKITNNVKANFSISNLLNHMHTEIMGGPAIGRVSTVRLQTTF